MPFVFHDECGAGFYEVSGWEGARGVFTTRKGGVSPHPFDSLNMGAGSGDSPGNVKKNRELLTAALGLPGAEIKMVRQVHGDDIYVLREPGSGIPGEAGQKPATGHDAVITDLKRAPIGVLTADCVPILLYDPKKSVVAAVHAGWAGTVKGIAGKAVAEMGRHFGSKPENLLASIGPSIGPCCYEIDSKVFDPLKESMPSAEEFVTNSRPGHWRLDLWKANMKTLEIAGVRPGRINVFGACTACNPEKFYSHRGSGGRAGRMMALTVLL